jgi:hypothetical protein
MQTNISVLRLVLAIGLFVIGGCSRSDRPPTAPVRGKVMYRGQPVAGATVSFLGRNAPRIASGETDEQGQFELTTFEANDGAVLGTHAVTVYKPAETIEPIGIDPNLDPQSYAAAMDRAATRAIKAQAAGSLLPERYADPKTSDLRFEVMTGENYCELNLAD